MNLGDMLRHSAARVPTKPALVCEDTVVSYAELDRSTGGADPQILLQDRLHKGKERLDNAIEALALLCEPVEPPKGELEHIHYFCGNTEIGGSPLALDIGRDFAGGSRIRPGRRNW